ncbi:PKD domain containing protein [Anopheles sinensis]|uniref:PKD domain containing protein n=1 Tax=Anopheles sinensis TaxID=74873 RepID=A0A084VHG4_ANOSI|nr:PKD domain containing protein [Anopheles sinensis]
MLNAVGFGGAGLSTFQKVEFPVVWKFCAGDGSNVYQQNAPHQHRKPLTRGIGGW